MSGITLLSGTGKGYRAEVDSDNKLNTRSVNTTELGYYSKKGSSFVNYGKHAIVAADTNEGLFMLDNEGQNDVVIEQVTLSSKCVSSMKIELFFDAVLSSGGTHVDAMNLNRASRKETTTHFSDNRNDDMEYTIDPALEFLDIRLSNGMPTFSYTFNDGLILSPSANLFGQVEGGAIGDKVRVNIYFYEVGTGGHGGH